LENDRTKFSKNKILFPTFVMDGPPQWAMVQSMTCRCCRYGVDANSGEILCSLPAYARNAYPVETKYAFDNKNCHLGRTVTELMDMMMPTSGNGDFCSRLLFNAINRSYIERVENYHSYCKHKSKEASAYVEKDGYYIRNYPPLGDGIRDAYDAACASQFTPWKVSDHDRHTREIQSVSCRFIFAQDHTHEVTKNYIRKKRMGAVALWDVATETGEIASAVLVPSTQTKHFVHAAAALTRRPTFNPSAMYSDTWPSKSSFWGLLFEKEVIGRLGLFHFIQRITRTLKKRHVDHFVCVNALLNCIYEYHQDDYEKLLTALKTGTLGSTKYSTQTMRSRI